VSDPDPVLPCPFCGSPATFRWNDDDEGLGAVECDNDQCLAVGRMDDWESAIEWWNRRPASQEPEEQPR
jgi:hypothetical protein